MSPRCAEELNSQAVFAGGNPLLGDSFPVKDGYTVCAVPRRKNTSFFGRARYLLPPWSAVIHVSG